MTSTNDGKEVKSNQTNSQTGKSYYIELYKSLDSRLCGDCTGVARTQCVCEAWRRIHSLCSHSAPATHPHLLSWLQRHTASTVLQTEWTKCEDQHALLANAIDAFLEDCSSAISKRNGVAKYWEQQLQTRAQWFKSILPNPWGHPVLKALLDSDQSPSDEQILEWLKEERGVMFVTRLRQMAALKSCVDLALRLTIAVMQRSRLCIRRILDTEQIDLQKEASEQASEASFGGILSNEAGFTPEIWEFLTDLEFVLLHKATQRSSCIDLAKQVPLRNACQLVERLQNRPNISPKEKKLWKNAKEVALLIAQVVITRCMVVPTCRGAVLMALYGCSRSIVRLMTEDQLSAASVALAAPAATAHHLHTMAAAVHKQLQGERTQFTCQLYVRAITAGMNELEKLKLDKNKSADARFTEKTLSTWFKNLGTLLCKSSRLKYECVLTAFSVHPSPGMYEEVKNAPHLEPIKDLQEPNHESTSEFGSWATDSHMQTNFVKTSETLNLKKTQKQANVLSTAFFSEGESLGLGLELCNDLAVLLSGPRVKTLTWDMEREALLENCKIYMKKTDFGTRALSTELKYLNLDPRSFQHLPEEDENEDDIYYGIEKGYEHLVEFQDPISDTMPPEIWQNVFYESPSQSSDDSIIRRPKKERKKKKKKIVSSLAEDPLKLDSDADQVTSCTGTPGIKLSQEEHNNDYNEDTNKGNNDVKIQGEIKTKKGKREGKREKKLKYTQKISTFDTGQEPKTDIVKKTALRKFLSMKVARKNSDLRRLIANTERMMFPARTTESRDKMLTSNILEKSDVVSNVPEKSEVVFDGLFSIDDMSFQETQDQGIRLKDETMKDKRLLMQPIPIEVTRAKPNIARDEKEDSKKNIKKLISFRRNNFDTIKNDAYQKDNTNSFDLKSESSIKPVSVIKTPLGQKLENVTHLPNVRTSNNLQNCTMPVSDGRVVSKLHNQPLKNHTSRSVAKSTYKSPGQQAYEEFVKSYETNLLNATAQSQPFSSTGERQFQEFIKRYNNDCPTATSEPMQSLKSNNTLRYTSEQSGLKYQITDYISSCGESEAYTPSASSNIHSTIVYEPTQRHFQEFLKELQDSINPSSSPASEQKFETKHANSSVCPKIVKASKKAANVPNTFSRLSYLHKNKQIENKLKPEEENKPKIVPNVDSDLNCMLPIHLQRKGQIQLNRIGKTSNGTDLILQGNEKRTDASKHQTCTDTVHTDNSKPKTKTRHNDTIFKDVIKTQTSATTMLSEKDQTELLQLLKQKSKLNWSNAVKMNALPKSGSADSVAHTTTWVNTSKIVAVPTANMESSVVKNKHVYCQNNFPSNKTGSLIVQNKHIQKPVTNMLSTEHRINNAIIKTPYSVTTHLSVQSSALKYTDPEIYKLQNTNLDPIRFETKCNNLGKKANDMTLNPCGTLDSFSEKPIADNNKSSLVQFMKNNNNKALEVKTDQCLQLLNAKPQPSVKEKPRKEFTNSRKRSKSNQIKKSDLNPGTKSWESVFNDLLKHKTPNRGPTALEIALQKNNVDKQITPQSTLNKIPKANQHVHINKIDDHKQEKKINIDFNAVVGNTSKALEKIEDKKFLEIHPKENDPFISGIPNSDYDLLDELMDDDLRQEIRELSDDDSYCPNRLYTQTEKINIGTSGTLIVKPVPSQTSKLNAETIDKQMIITLNNPKSVIPNSVQKPSKIGLSNKSRINSNELINTSNTINNVIIKKEHAKNENSTKVSSNSQLKTDCSGGVVTHTDKYNKFNSATIAKPNKLTSLLHNRNNSELSLVLQSKKQTMEAPLPILPASHSAVQPSYNSNKPDQIGLVQVLSPVLQENYFKEIILKPISKNTTIESDNSVLKSSDLLSKSLNAAVSCNEKISETTSLIAQNTAIMAATTEVSSAQDLMNELPPPLTKQPYSTNSCKPINMPTIYPTILGSTVIKPVIIKESSIESNKKHYNEASQEKQNQVVINRSVIVTQAHQSKTTSSNVKSIRDNECCNMTPLNNCWNENSPKDNSQLTTVDLLCRPNEQKIFYGMQKTLPMFSKERSERIKNKQLSLLNRPTEQYISLPSIPLPYKSLNNIKTAETIDTNILKMKIDKAETKSNNICKELLESEMLIEKDLSEGKIENPAFKLTLINNNLSNVISPFVIKTSEVEKGEKEKSLFKYKANDTFSDEIIPLIVKTTEGIEIIDTPTPKSALVKDCVSDITTPLGEINKEPEFKSIITKDTIGYVMAQLDENSTDNSLSIKKKSSGSIIKRMDSKRITLKTKASIDSTIDCNERVFKNNRLDADDTNVSASLKYSNNLNFVDKDTISFVELPRKPNDDPTKRKVRIKANGATLTATICGHVDINIDSIFSDPEIRNIVLQNSVNRTACTINVKQKTIIEKTKSENKIINTILYPPNAKSIKPEVIDLVSEDEFEEMDEVVYKTEFADFTSTFRENENFLKHQTRLSQKCTVNITRSEFMEKIIASKSICHSLSNTLDKGYQINENNTDVIDIDDSSNDSLIEINKPLPKESTFKSKLITDLDVLRSSIIKGLKTNEITKLNKNDTINALYKRHSEESKHVSYTRSRKKYNALTRNIIKTKNVNLKNCFVELIRCDHHQNSDFLKSKHNEVLIGEKLLFNENKGETDLFSNNKCSDVVEIENQEREKYEVSLSYMKVSDQESKPVCNCTASKDVSHISTCVSHNKKVQQALSNEKHPEVDEQELLNKKSIINTGGSKESPLIETQNMCAHKSSLTYDDPTNSLQTCNYEKASSQIGETKSESDEQSLNLEKHVEIIRIEKHLRGESKKSEFSALNRSLDCKDLNIPNTLYEKEAMNFELIPENQSAITNQESLIDFVKKRLPLNEADVEDDKNVEINSTIKEQFKNNNLIRNEKLNISLNQERGLLHSKFPVSDTEMLQDKISTSSELEIVKKDDLLTKARFDDVPTIFVEENQRSPSILECHSPFSNIKDYTVNFEPHLQTLNCCAEWFVTKRSINMQYSDLHVHYRNRLIEDNKNNKYNGFDVREEYKICTENSIHTSKVFNICDTDWFLTKSSIHDNSIPLFLDFITFHHNSVEQIPSASYIDEDLPKQCNKTHVLSLLTIMTNYIVNNSAVIDISKPVIPIIIPQFNKYRNRKRRMFKTVPTSENKMEHKLVLKKLKHMEPINENLEQIPAMTDGINIADFDNKNNELPIKCYRNRSPAMDKLNIQEFIHNEKMLYSKCVLLYPNNSDLDRNHTQSDSKSACNRELLTRLKSPITLQERLSSNVTDLVLTDVGTVPLQQEPNKSNQEEQYLKYKIDNTNSNLHDSGNFKRNGCEILEKKAKESIECDRNDSVYENKNNEESQKILVKTDKYDIYLEHTSEIKEITLNSQKNCNDSNLGTGKPREVTVEMPTGSNVNRNFCNERSDLTKENITLLYKGDDSDIILKGSVYKDPIIGTCYLFPIHRSIKSNIKAVSDVEVESIGKEINVPTDVSIFESNFNVLIPKITYSKQELITDLYFKSKKNLKRKSDSLDNKYSTIKRYRKGKNINYPKNPATKDFAYVKEFKALFEYWESIKFSFSRAFHKENWDVNKLHKFWPIQGALNLHTDKSEDDIALFLYDDEPRSEYDPLCQSLAEEIASEGSEIEYKSIEINETNFSMGFGEGSDRVIQQYEDLNTFQETSAATLSDVKPQPFSGSDYSKIKLKNSVKYQTHKDDIEVTKRFLNYIKQKNKVRSFFKKTNVELNLEWMSCNVKENGKKCKQYSDSNYPFEVHNFDFFTVPSIETIVQVVQVGQLPVSAAAQNPVSCDPRITQVTDASPPQCSAENSPRDGSQPSVRNEYTELTTADLSLPLVEEYERQNNQTISLLSQAENNKLAFSDENIPIEKETNSIVEIEIAEESLENEEEIHNDDSELQKIISQHSNNKDSFTNDSSTVTESQVLSFQNLKETESFLKNEECNEKTDQIAHAMSAAGITTSSEQLPRSESQIIDNVRRDKINEETSSIPLTSSTNYSKAASINAISLQQALAQILPPPLNRTNTSGSNQQSSNPQILHFVQGKNSNSVNQITLMDNTHQSVLNASNSTPVLHIVQNKGQANSNNTGQLTNSFNGLPLVDSNNIQQGSSQLLHIVNTSGQKTNNTSQLLKRVNLLTNLSNVQSGNEQKMVQFVCKSADGKSIQLNAAHQRSMVLRIQPIESSNVQSTKSVEHHNDVSVNGNAFNANSVNENTSSQQEIKSRSVYEENYAKFIQNSGKSTITEKSTSLPKFNQAFGKQVFQDENQKVSVTENHSHLTTASSANEVPECQNDNSISLDQIGHLNNPPLLLRKATSQSALQTQSTHQSLVTQLKQTVTPMNLQTMHNGVIYTRQIPVNIGGGQTINLITVPSTELIDDSNQKQHCNSSDVEPSIIKIVPQNSNPNSERAPDERRSQATTDTSNPQPQPVLTQMRIKLPMLSKPSQMVSSARVVRPSFFQIQRNVIGGANQPVYQQLVLTAAPPLGQQTIRLPQSQTNRLIKVPAENQTTSESQMSSSTLEQLREFDMVLEQVKERSTVQPNQSNSGNAFNKGHTPSTDTTDTSSHSTSTDSTQQVLYTIGNNSSLNVAYVNRKATVNPTSVTTYVRSPDSSNINESPSSSTQTQVSHTVTTESHQTNESSSQNQHKVSKISSKSKSRPKPSPNPSSSVKINTVPPKPSTQKPFEDEQTTQRILYILAEYKEQVENSPDKDKPAPRRRSNPPSNPGSSKRKKSSSSSRRPGTRDISPVHGEDTCRTMGSEDSSCGTSQGDCTESCLDSHSPQDSPRKVVRKLSFEPETPTAQPRPQPQRNVIVADGQTITVARNNTGKPTTAVLMPANYILPVSMVKSGQQIAIVTNRGPKILTVGGGEGGGNTVLLQRLIGPGLKPMLTRPGVRHVRLPTAAIQNLQAFTLGSTTGQQPDSTASVVHPNPPELIDTRATSSPWAEREGQDLRPEKQSSPGSTEPWNLASHEPHDYSYEEIVRSDNMDRTVLDAIPDRYSPDMEAQRIFDKMFDIDSKRSYIVDSQDDSPRCGYDIDASECDDKPFHQVVHRKDGTTQRHHRLAHVSSAALKHRYAILEHELRLQKSLSEECEDLGVDSPSAAELFPEAELLFSSSPAHEAPHHSHTPQPIINQGTIPHPDIDDQIATDHLICQNDAPDDEDLNMALGLDNIVTVSGDGTITLDPQEFARSHPNTTFHKEPTDESELQPFTIANVKGRHMTSTIFHASRAPATVLVTAPQTTVIAQAAPDGGIQNNLKYSDTPSNSQQGSIPSVLVKDNGVSKFDSMLNRELHLSNTASTIIHSGATQVIRRVCYDDDKHDPKYLESHALMGEDAKMAEDSRDATLESMADVDDDRSSPDRNEMFWESNSTSERSEGRRPLDFSSDSDKCCKSPFEETNSTDSSGIGTHIMRLDSVIKDARGIERSGSVDGSSAEDTLPPLRTYPPKRYHPPEADERSTSGKTRAGERSPDSMESRRRASNRGVVKRGCHCCNGSPAPSKPKKSRLRKPNTEFTT